MSRVFQYRKLNVANPAVRMYEVVHEGEVVGTVTGTKKYGKWGWNGFPTRDRAAHALIGKLGEALRSGR